MSSPNLVIAPTSPGLVQDPRSLALPGEDPGEIQASMARHVSQMNPRTDLGMTLVFRVVLLTLRLRRSVEHEARSLAAKGVAYDDSPEAARASRLEAATSRELFQTLKEFRRIEAEYAANLDANPEMEASSMRLASFRNSVDEAPPEPSPEVGPHEPSAIGTEADKEVSDPLVAITPAPGTSPVVQVQVAPVMATLPEFPPRISFYDPKDPPRSVGWNGYHQF